MNRTTLLSIALLLAAGCTPTAGELDYAPDQPLTEEADGEDEGVELPLDEDALDEEEFLEEEDENAVDETEDPESPEEPTEPEEPEEPTEPEEPEEPTEPEEPEEPTEPEEPAEPAAWDGVATVYVIGWGDEMVDCDPEEGCGMSEVQFTLEAVGGPVTDLQIQLIGDSPWYWDADHEVPQLLPGQPQTIEVLFEPSNAGEYEADLFLTGNAQFVVDGEPTEGQGVIGLFGEGLYPDDEEDEEEPCREDEGGC